MSPAFVGKHRAYVVIGGVGIAFAVGYLALSLQLPFGRLDQPGAGVFPVVVGALLLLGSLATMWEGWKGAAADAVRMPVGADRKRLLCLVGLLLGYIVLLPWLGQMVSSTLFCILLIRLLSTLGWLRIVVYAAAMALALEVVFVFLLKVPMPRGVLGM